jgi:hypothetical protein
MNDKSSAYSTDITSDTYARKEEGVNKLRRGAQKNEKRSIGFANETLCWRLRKRSKKSRKQKAKR